MPQVPPVTLAGFKRLLWSGLTAVLAALLAALLAWYVTSRTNARMVVQQQEIAAIDQFDSSGANLDSTMSDFIDDVVDGDPRPDLRKALRSAIALHAAKAQRLTNIVGQKPIEEYTAGLGQLRIMSDEAEDVQSGIVMAQLHANILANKKRISDAAWRSSER